MYTNSHPVDPDTQKTLVIDVTYKCNGLCRYCQWSATKPSETYQFSRKDLFIPRTTLQALGTQRVVFSGGEPLLSPYIDELVCYYREYGMESIVILTNGLVMDPPTMKRLIDYGITGISFSIDTFDPEIASKTRGLTPSQLAQIECNLLAACEVKNQYGLEIGINVTLTHFTLTERNFSNLVGKLSYLPIDWVKFQPLFDDGFVSTHAPDLLIRQTEIQEILKCAAIVQSRLKCKSNSESFWGELTKLLSGANLDGKYCGIDDRIAIVIRGEIKFCYWMDHPIYGKVEKRIDGSLVERQKKAFMLQKYKCSTGMYCYCLQKMNHCWN